MRFKELPREVQKYIYTCTQLINEIEQGIEDDLIQDDYTKKIIELCNINYTEMKRALDFIDND